VSGKFLAMISFIYILIAFLGFTFNGAWETSNSSLQTMANIAQGSQNLSLFGIIALPVQVPGWISSVYQIMTLQFPFLMSGGTSMFYWIVLLPIAICGVACLLMLFYGMLRGNISWG